MLQTGETFWRRRLNGSTEDEFSVFPEWRAEGMTDYVAIITRFAAEGVIGEMDGVYSAWATRQPEGFTNVQIATLKRIVPDLGLAVKSVSLARMQRRRVHKSLFCNIAGIGGLLNRTTDRADNQGNFP
jgi:adenylate cyclase